MTKDGSVALTQGSFNTTRILFPRPLPATMAEVCPKLKVLAPEEEGFDPPKAIAKAVAIIQANPDIVAALSTTVEGRRRGLVRSKRRVWNWSPSGWTTRG